MKTIIKIKFLFLFSCTLLIPQDSTYLNQIIVDFQVNENETNFTRSPSISVDKNGNFIICWVGDSNNKTNIYAQLYSKDGIKLGDNVRVNEFEGDQEPMAHPYISVDVSRSFVVTWIQVRNDSTNIFAQRFSSDGTKLGPNFIVNEHKGNVNAPTIDADSKGNFVIAWTDWSNINAEKIYIQLYTNEGLAIGSNFTVNEINDVGCSSPSICVDSSGNFILSWRASNEGSSWIYGQRFSNNGSKLGDIFKVNDDEGVVPYYSAPSISCDIDGCFLIAWLDERGDILGNIYAQRFKSDGILLGNNFKVNDDDEIAFQRYPSVSGDVNGNFIITWSDLRENGGIYAQRYSIDGDTIGNNFRITNTSTSGQWRPDVKLLDGRIYTAWQDSRVDSNYDIWANVWQINYNPTAIAERNSIPNKFALSHNYPNPFNPSTTIKYSIPSSVISNERSDVRNPNGSKIFPSGRNDNMNVSVKVYDILGREVATLVNKKQKPGNYEVTWDGLSASGGQVPSGVYFYQLKNGKYRATKKMILLR